MGGCEGATLLGSPVLGSGKRPTGTCPKTVSCVAPEFLSARSSVAARRASALATAPPATVDSEVPPFPRRRGGA